MLKISSSHALWRSAAAAPLLAAFILVSVSSGAVAQGATQEPAQQPPQQQSQQAQAQQLGGPASFNCSRTKCTCTGAEDCLDLGGTGLCKGRVTCSGNVCFCDRGAAAAELPR
jgi:hypothetical protein